MSDFDYGPLQTWEITWQSGHIEAVQGHQILFESFGLHISGPPPINPKMTIHGKFGEQWLLVLQAPESDVIGIRLITDREESPA